MHFLLSSVAPQITRPDDVLNESGSCVASGEELYQAFLRRGIKPSDKYQFDTHYPDLDYFTHYTTFIVVYNTTTLTEDADGTVSTDYTLPESSSNRCCDPSNDEDCFAVLTTHQTVYRILPPPLVYMLALPWFTPFDSLDKRYYLPAFIQDELFIGCWSTPPFCVCSQSTRTILKDFTSYLVSYLII